MGQDKLKAKLTELIQDPVIRFIDSFETINDRNRDLLGCLLLLIENNHFIYNVASSSLSSDLAEEL